MLVDLAELAALVEGERFVRPAQHGGIGSVVHPMPTMGTWFRPPVRRWIYVGTVLSKRKGRGILPASRPVAPGRKPPVRTALLLFASSDLSVTGGSAGALTVRRGQRLDP